MSFISINPNTFINTEEIECVEQIGGENEARLVVWAGGREYQVSPENEERILTIIQNAGKQEQYWAGR